MVEGISARIRIPETVLWAMTASRQVRERACRQGARGQEGVWSRGHAGICSPWVVRRGFGLIRITHTALLALRVLPVCPRPFLPLTATWIYRANSRLLSLQQAHI